MDIICKRVKRHEEGYCTEVIMGEKKLKQMNVRVLGSLYMLLVSEEKQDIDADRKI